MEVRLLAVLLLIGSTATQPLGAARRERLELGYQGLELPGAPAAVVAADVDGDGRQDLTLFVAYSEWDQIGIEERSEMQGVEGLVETLTVVPALFERREIRLYLGAEGGGFELAGEPLAVDASVLSMEAGNAAAPVVLLTDEGMSALRLEVTDEVAAKPGALRRGALRLEPLLAVPPATSGSGSFIPELGLVREIDGRPPRDLLLPTRGGLRVHLGTAGGFTSDPTARIEWPRLIEPRRRRARSLFLPLPELVDLDADGRDDLVFRRPDGEWVGPHLALNRGDGRIAAVIGPIAELPTGEEGEPVWIGDLDGDGRAELLTQEELEPEDAGWRKEMRHAKRPPHRYRIYPIAEDFSLAGEPRLEFEATGWAFPNAAELRIPGGFRDLNGDGRQDLVALTLDFSILQAVRILTTRSIKIGIDFHLWCQRPDGSFREVTDLDLSGVFRIDLDNLRLGRRSLFDGDFDGDGVADFVQMGRGRKVSIHRGDERCAYPASPDLELELREEPRDLGLVEITDLDGDGLSDLMVIQPQEMDETGETPPVRLDLYLSGGAQ